MIRSNAFWTARSPLALEMTTGFAAQRLRGGKGRGGRMTCGMSAAAPAAKPTAADVTNSRRDTASDTAGSRALGECLVLADQLTAVNLLRFRRGSRFRP